MLRNKWPLLHLEPPAIRQFRQSRTRRNPMARSSVSQFDRIEPIPAVTMRDSEYTNTPACGLSKWHQSSRGFRVSRMMLKNRNSSMYNSQTESVPSYNPKMSYRKSPTKLPPLRQSKIGRIKEPVLDYGQATSSALSITSKEAMMLSKDLAVIV